GQLVTRGRGLRSEPEVAQLALDVVELGVGAKVVVLLAAAEDYGWTSSTGAKLADDAAPDPLLGAWLAEQRGALFDHQLDLKAPDDLRDALAAVLVRASAHTLIPVASHDELLALVLVPGKRLRGARLAFVESA